jgi:hypothetical protein
MKVFPECLYLNAKMNQVSIKEMTVAKKGLLKTAGLKLLPVIASSAIS